MKSAYLEFLAPEPTIECEIVLPSWVWVSAGANEIFFDGVKLWVGILHERFGYRRVGFEVGIGKVHVWQWIETMIDQAMKKAFLRREMGDGRGFEVTANGGKSDCRKSQSRLGDYSKLKVSQDPYQPSSSHSDPLDAQCRCLTLSA